jgi:hypothetical protein
VCPPGRALALLLAAAALTTGCAGPKPPARPALLPEERAQGVTARGLSTSTAFVTVMRRRPMRLESRAASPILDAIWQVLGAVPAMTPQPGGPRLLANLRMNEDLVDVTIWHAQDLDVAGQRLGGVSGIVIPFTGSWRHRVLIIREGRVDASPALPDSPELATIERAVDTAGNHS